MIFVKVKNPLHQDSPDSCVPTCIKVVLKSQFAIERRISAVKKWLQYERGAGVNSPYKIPAMLEEPLSQFDVVTLVKSNASNKDILELLEKKILPFILIRPIYLNETNVKKIKIYEGGDDWWHSVVICGYDDSNEKVFIYDPFLTYIGSELNEGNCQVVIPYALLTKYWKETTNRLFWLASQKGRPKEKDALLQSFFNEGES